MAVEFHTAVGDSDILYLTSAVATDAPITIVGFFKVPTDPLSARTISKIGYFDERGGFGLHISGATGGNRRVVAFETFAHLSASAHSADNYGITDWHHAAAVFASTTSRTAYLDGIPGITNTDTMPDQAPFVMDRTGVAWDMAFSDFSFGFDGCLAHVAIWNIALSDSEIAQLAGGTLPSAVQPGNLVLYAPLTDEASATTNTPGPALTLNESPTGINTCVDDPTPEEPAECGTEDQADEIGDADVTWPECDLIPTAISVDVMIASISPGRSFSGHEQVVQAEAGCWRITLDGVRVRTRDHVLQWREIESALNGRNGTILIPVYEAPLSNTAVAAMIAGGETAGYPIGSTRIGLIQTAGASITAGQHFSHGEWLYRVARVLDIDGGVQNVKIWPPVREAMIDNDVLDFNTPRCRCRLERDDGMDINLELLRYARPTVTFVEDDPGQRV